MAGYADEMSDIEALEFEYSHLEEARYALKNAQRELGEGSNCVNEDLARAIGELVDACDTRMEELDPILDAAEKREREYMLGSYYRSVL